MRNRVRWGILGTGIIAAKFAEALKSIPDADLWAVGSRSQPTAESFGGRFGVRRRFGSYAALLEDPAVEAVYVATPHSAHCENALAALRAGKAVLVEKPFAINARETEAVIAEAKRRNLLLMEAMWTRYLPLYVELRHLLRENAIGDLHLMVADFGVKATPESRPRLFDPALGGGALLDVGVYPVSLASMLFGPPLTATGAARLGPTGVDEEDCILLQHEGGRLAQAFCAISLASTLEVLLVGTGGQIRIHAPFWKSSALTLLRTGEPPQELRFPFPGNGYQFEALEFMRCVRAGRKESATMPLAESVQIMKTLDTLRGQWKLKYPMEP